MGSDGAASELIEQARADVSVPRVIADLAEVEAHHAAAAEGDLGGGDAFAGVAIGALRG